ncbi:MAG: peptidoglycan-binding protein [Clostridia bacterium]|nr:peptidoglycan-binding protein [Clostridia bacterium]
MKRLISIVLAAALLAAFAVPALAEYVMYANQDNVKVYKSPDTKSKVLKKLSGCDKVTVVDFNSGGDFIGVQVKVKGKKVTGWVLDKYLSQEFPASRCTHKWGDWQVEKKATCTEEGWRVRYCKKCGIMDEGAIARKDHSYGSWKVTKEATCTKKGTEERVCKNCGNVQTRETEKAPHTFGKWKILKKATCTKTGLRSSTCKVCGYEEQEEYVEPHEFGAWEVTKEATCTRTGKQVRTCEVCGYEESKTIAKLPHDYKWDVIVEATDHSSGVRAKVCRVCGHTEAEQDYDPEGTLRRGDQSVEVYNMQQLLIDQGYLNVGAADGVFGGGTEKAVKQFQKDQSLQADGVAWPQTIKRLSHEFGPWETVREMTRTEPGERVRVCLECGYEQHETIESGTVFERGRRGEDIRALQQIVKQLGYDAGGFDGIYGKKLDAALAAFAAENGLQVEEGRIRPGDVDALVNAWLTKLPDERWKGEGDDDAPVSLALSVTPVGEPDESGVTAYKWSLTNLGSEECTFAAVLLTFGETADFKDDSLVMVLDGVRMKPGAGNSASGSFSADKDWEEGNLNFAAVAVSEETGVFWLSNTVTFENEFAPEDDESAEKTAKAQTVEPVQEDIDLNALKDGTYPVAFDRGDILNGASGVYMNAMHVYTVDIYSAADIEGLAVGDTVVAEGTGHTVNEVYVDEYGDVVVNGGIDGEDGYVFTAIDEGLHYRVLGLDDYPTYTERGTTTLMLDTSAVYTDSSDPEAEPVTAEYAGIVDAMLNSDNEYFDLYNTTVRIEDGRVVGIVRVYNP